MSTIYGVALMALCALIGVAAGDYLGALLHVKADVGGVGIAMVLLVAARSYLIKRNALSPGITLAATFWATMYIPIVVAMAAQQDVVSALGSGSMVLIAGTVTVFVCLILVAALGRLDRRTTVESGSGVEQEELL